MQNNPLFGSFALLSLLPLLFWSFCQTGLWGETCSRWCKFQPFGKKPCEQQGETTGLSGQFLGLEKIFPGFIVRERVGHFWLWLFLAILGCGLMAGHLLLTPWQMGLSLTLWVTIATCLIMFFIFSMLSGEGWRLSTLLAPYLFLLALFALILGTSRPISAAVTHVQFWMAIHIVLSVMTYALLTLSAVSGLAVFLRERGLKRKQTGSFLRCLPSVADGQRYQLFLLAMSEILLGLGLLTGMALEYEAYGKWIEVSHKVLFSFVTFGVIAILLIAHLWAGIRGRKAARFVLLAYLFLTLGFPGVKFVTDIILS